MIASLESVSFRYPKQAEPVISDFSLELAQGEFFVLVGPSGCGKTTVLNMLAGFVHPSTGTCSMKGRPIRRPARERAVIFQGDDSLFHWLTVYDNAQFGLRLSRTPSKERAEKVEWALELTGLATHRKKYPKELSGGMKQRLQLARALVCDTDLLLMDEPFAALDAFTRAELQVQLIEIWETTHLSVLFITHDIAEALTLGSRIGLMSRGPHAVLTRVIDVDVERPRSHADPRFGQLFEDIRGSLAEGGARRFRDARSCTSNVTDQRLLIRGSESG